MIFQRGGGTDPVGDGPVGKGPAELELRRDSAGWVLAAGTLACPRCDAPIALGGDVLTPADSLGCPFCAHAGAVRDFLSLAVPTRPTRVRVRVRAPAPAAR